MDYVLLAVFLGLTLLGVPVAFTLALAVASILVFFIDKPLVMVTQIMFSGIDSFSFMAVPFFMLAGSFMSAGGVTMRLVNFSQSLVGSFRGGLAQTVSVSGCFFAAISGSSAATTAALGTTMVDAMDKMLMDGGYWPRERRHVDDNYAQLVPLIEQSGVFKLKHQDQIIAGFMMARSSRRSITLNSSDCAEPAATWQ